MFFLFLLSSIGVFFDFSFYYSDRNKIDIIFLLLYIVDYHCFIILFTKF